MRIVIDLQGAQTESRYRGIGRYSLSISKAIARNSSSNHEVIIVLSNIFTDSIDSIKEEFKGILPLENIKIWNGIAPVKECEEGNNKRREISEILREAFIANLKPDMVIITSLFEGYVDDAVTSIKKFDKNSKVAVIGYDLIPYIHKERYLLNNKLFKDYYLRKIEYLKKADFILGISESSCNEFIEYLNFNKDNIVNISASVDDSFKPKKISKATKDKLFKKFNITKKTIVYAPGGFDVRKNFENLIEAYSLLSSNLKENYQLIILGKISEENRTTLFEIAKDKGVKKSDFIITGYITDEELITFYSICDLFVFPSLHEGFGLPVLEAMSCGAIVIGSNTTSIPEVIGCKEALFNPSSATSIANKIEEIIKNKNLQEKIKNYNKIQIKKFSWDKSAKTAIKFIEKEYKENYKKQISTEAIIKNITEHIQDNYTNNELFKVASAIEKNQNQFIKKQLFLDVSELSQRDSGTGVQRVVKSYLKELLQSPPKDYIVAPVYATVNGEYKYANRFTAKFLGIENWDDLKDLPIIWNRGDIFFGLDMQHHVQLSKKEFYHQLKNDGVTVKFLVYDLLPIELKEMFKDNNHNKLHEELMKMFAQFDGVINISKTTSETYNNFLENQKIITLSNFKNDWLHIGADKVLSSSSVTSSNSFELLEVFKKRPTFLTVSTIEPRKRQEQIFQAFNILWSKGLDINLVFVGRQGWKVNKLITQVTNNKEYNKRLFWLNGIDDEYLRKVYETSTCLISASINEGFGLPLIEAAQYKLPIIARDIEIFREVAGNYAYYFEGFKASDLATSIENWLKLYKANRHPKSDNMPFLTWKESAEKLKIALIHSNKTKKNIFIDISEIIHRDAKSGIQRVVRSILLELFKNPPKNYNIEPVYATIDEGYKYATNFTYKFLGHNTPHIEEKYIKYKNGDQFLILDMQPIVQISKREYYKKLIDNGVKVSFLLNDLLPIRMSKYFPEGSKESFENWLRVMSQNSQAICISKSVKNDYINWLKETNNKLIKTDYFHLGADIENSKPSLGLPKNSQTIFNNLKNRTTFLIVGTLEPRKGHMQTLKAFTKLWKDGLDINLVIVGKKGWKIEDVTNFIENHPEFNKKLFWLNGISDEYLEEIYKVSDALLAPSEGEGFGLPLIEAAQHKLPIIARDIPVFREVASKYAYYFQNSKDSEVIVSSIIDWLKLYKSNTHPKSDNMPWLTWEESTEQLISILLKNS